MKLGGAYHECALMIGWLSSKQTLNIYQLTSLKLVPFFYIPSHNTFCHVYTPFAVQ